MRMKKSTQWFISGAMWLCLALVTYITRASAEQRAFWFGISDLPAIEIVLLNYGLYIISAAFVVGIACLAVGLSKAGILAVTMEKESTTAKEISATPVNREIATNTQKETVIKEFIMAPCENCESLIPQTSTFCPDCGVRRKQ